MSESYSESVFATDLPQAQKDFIGQWRISAGFRGWIFVAKTAKKADFQP
jgi:hypothetical protein